MMVFSKNKKCFELINQFENGELLPCKMTLAYENKELILVPHA
jgi:hypothetical protein